MIFIEKKIDYRSSKIRIAFNRKYKFKRVKVQNTNNLGMVSLAKGGQFGSRVGLGGE